MPGLLEPYPFSGIFPELPAEELSHLAQDIKERGQIEPIILYKGQILDGRNRHKACQMIGVSLALRNLTQRPPNEARKNSSSVAICGDAI